MPVIRRAIVFGETNLAISCMEHLRNSGWRIDAVITRSPDVTNWCKTKEIQYLTIDQVFQLKISNAYVFSIINPYILSTSLLTQLQPIRAFNYHDSLLPKYAGVNSTTWAISNDEKYHGVSWHEITNGIDEGDIYYQAKIAIDEIDTAFSLNFKCTDAALVGFTKLINDIEHNTLIALKQNLSKKTYYGRDYIPTNYAYINQNDDIHYINKLLNSLNFGDEYINPVATAKVSIDSTFYILEKVVANGINRVDSSTCTLKNIYGKKVTRDFDLAQIESCILNTTDSENLRKIKQDEFYSSNKIAKTLDELEVQSGLLSSTITEGAQEELELNIIIPAETLCTFLYIILSRLNANNTFIKIYHKNTCDTSELLRTITENISILSVSAGNLNLSYLEMAKKIVDDIAHNKFHIVKDFGYRYKINLCSDFAVVDNYLEEIDNHQVVFAILQDKIFVKYYSKDFDFVKVLVKTITVFFAKFEEIQTSNVQVKKIQLLSTEDYKKVIYDWNKTVAEYSNDKTINQLFEEQVAKTPDNIAVIYDNIKLTYKELNSRSNQLAHYLRNNHQIQGDDLIVLCLDKSEYMLIAILATLKSGAAYVPIDPSYPDERIGYILEDTNAKTVLANEEYEGKLDEILGKRTRGHHLICAIDSSKLRAKLKKLSSINLIQHISSKNLAYVIYTSGTTGIPKGVLQQHNNVIRLFTATQNWYNFDNKDVWTFFHSYVFDFSVWEIWGALIYGGRLIIPNYEQMQDLNLFYELCKICCVTVLNQTPQVFYQLIDLAIENNKLDSLRYVILGGDSLDLSQLKRWFDSYSDAKPRLINMYGTTETTVHVTYKPVELNDIGKNLYIGNVIPDQKIYILDSNLNPLPIGAIGELYVGGAGLARGYLNHPELTKEKFISNPFQSTEEKKQSSNGRLYKTGDLVRYLTDGNIEYICRNDFQVKIRGFRIELGEIETRLNNYAGVKQAVILVKEHSDNTGTQIGSKYLVGYYVATNKLDNEAINAYLEANLPDYMVPSILIWLEKLPLTHNGKLDRKALPSPELTNKETYVAPRNELEAQVCAVYAEVLGLPIDRVGITDDFFRLGGDSILSIRLISQLKRIGINIDVRKLYLDRTTITLLSSNKDNITEDIAYKPFSLVDSKTKDKIISTENLIVEDIFPASYLQIGMILEYEKNRDYHIVTFYKIKLLLDINNVYDAFRVLMMRHEMLRCSCIEDEKYLFLLVQYNEVNLNNKIKCLQDGISDLVGNEIGTPINRLEPGLFRVVIRPESDGFDLILTTHHAIQDGWSVESLISEFVDIYSGQRKKEYYVPPYAKYVAKELTALSDNKHQSFWRKYLSNLEINASNLIFDKKYISNEKLVVSQKTLSNITSKKLLEISRTLNITPDIIFLSLYSITISKFINNNNLIVGVVINNRLEEHNGDKVFGLHLNTIPIKFKINPNDLSNIKEYLLNCQKEKLKVYEYRLYPYGKLKADLNLSEDIYSFAFNYVHFHIMSDKYKNNIVALNYEYQKTNIPCLFNVSRHDNQFNISINAKNTFIDTNIVNKFLDYVEYYIDCFISVNKIDLLLPTESKLISIWNQTEKEFPQNKTIHELFEDQVVKTPDSIAVVYENIEWTYKTINETSNQLAYYLRANYQIQGDDLIALCVDRSAYMLIAILATLKSGAAYVPIDPNYPDERIKYILQDAQVKAILVNEIYQDKLKNLVTAFQDLISNQISICAIDDVNLQTKFKQFPSKNLMQKITNSNLAYIIYTSGTTGKPNGVMIEHKGVVNRITWMNAEYKLSEYDHVLQKTPYVFDVSVWELFWAIWYGATVVFAKPEYHKDPEYLIDIIAKEKISVIHMVPSMLNEFSNILYHRPDKSVKARSLRYLFCSGEALSLNDIKHFSELMPHVKIHNLYGPTETSIDVLHFECNTEDLSLVYIGKPIFNTQVYVLNENLTQLPIGAVGELYVGGIGLARGYLNQPILTKSRFIDNPFQNTDDKTQYKNEKLYKTGDLVRYSLDGNLEYIGRSDFQVKIHGFRIEPEEIENILNSYNGIKKSIVIATEYTNNNDISLGTKYLVAYYIADEALNENAILTYLEGILPEYMMPQAAIWLEKLPLTHNGKLDKSLLPAPKFGVKGACIAPRNIVELKICTFYSEILNLPTNRVSIDDDFFDLGGNSILAIHLLYKLQQEFKISLNDIFKLKTPSRIAKLARFTKNSLYHRLKQIKFVYDKLSSYKINSEMQKKKALYLAQVNQMQFIEKAKNIRLVLLTGATGHLGCHILYQLLCETKYKIYLLVRATSNSEAYTRLNNKFKFYFNSSLEHYQNRVTVVAADIEKQNLGLNYDQYKELISNVDSIIHSAALVKHYGDYATFYQANVQTTINLLELARHTRMKDFHYISTLSMLTNCHMPNCHYHIWTEDDNEIGMENNISTIYIKTKYESELATIEYRKFGVNSNIYRVGNLAMNSKNYHNQENIEENAFFTRIQTILNLGIMPKEIVNVEISPVDCTALAITKLFNQVSLSNETYHIANPQLCNLSDLFAQCDNVNVKTVPFEEFIDALLVRLNNTINRQQIERFMLHQMWLEDIDLNKLTQIVVLQNKTDKILSNLNISWPKITPQMISSIINHTCSGSKKMKKKELIFEYLESIAELIPASFYWLDVNGKCIGLNTLCVQAVGAISKEDVINKDVYELYPDKDVASELQYAIDGVVRTGIPSRREDKIIDGITGKIKYMSSTRAALRNKNGEIIGIVGTSIEITAEKEAVIAQKEAEGLRIENEANKAALAQKEAERLKFENEANKAKVLQLENESRLFLLENEAKVKSLQLENEANKAALAQKEAEALRFQNEALQVAAQEQEKFRTIVKQVMHDITSPIVSIENIVSKLSSKVPERDRVTLRHAVESINGISHRLLSQYNEENLEAEDENFLAALAVLQIINEKREGYRKNNVAIEVDIAEEVKFMFIKHNSGMFKRMISNLTNNAVDALKNRTDGKITVMLGATPDDIVLVIKDNGPGMLKHIIDKFKQGIEVTEGKENGHGVGLTQVRDAITSGNGTYKIYASSDGTKITIWFPKVATPSWLATEIKLTKDDTVLILDDDKSIHGSWESSFKSILEDNPTLKAKHFTKGKEVVKYINKLTPEQKENTFLLTDYELIDQGINGLEVVAQTKMHRAILVTSYASSSAKQIAVTKYGIKMLPKELAASAKIKVDKKIPKGSNKVDIVWVEDIDWFVNDLVRDYYSDLKVDVYYDPVSFMDDVHQYPLATRIILDNNYASPEGILYDVTGYDLAEKLHEMGYTTLILLTGEAPKSNVPKYLTVLRKADLEALKRLDKI